MAGKSTERKTKTKETKSGGAVDQNDTGGFTLPDSLPCSEVDFPVLIKKRPRANWEEIIDESNKWHKQIEEFQESKLVPKPKPPFLRTETDYIKNEVFVQLIPALVETLNKAKLWQAFTKDKCFFNGIDHIVQVLWNNNPRYPGRKESDLHLFNMPWVRATLKKSPRPLYPKSWLWPEEYAATLIQKTVRQYFIQRQEEVQEMRDFWRKLEVERKVPDMEFNPFLAKAFASSSHIKKLAYIIAVRRLKEKVSQIKFKRLNEKGSRQARKLCQYYTRFKAKKVLK